MTTSLIYIVFLNTFVDRLEFIHGEDVNVMGAHYCDKMRPGEFGGYVTVVTRTGIKGTSTHEMALEILRKLKKTENTSAGVHVCEVEVTDPDSKSQVSLEIIKDSASGAMVGLDSSFIEAFEPEKIPSPFNEGGFIAVPE